jgi:phage-related minor tail protein
MADKRIKGITIEIGGDTVRLDKALKDVNKQSNTLKSELKDVERLLKFDPGNAEATAQKQKLLADQINVTAERLKYLKDAQKEVEAQFQKGSISEEQYRNFRREIEFTEGSLKKLKASLSQVNAGSPLKDMAKDAEDAKGSVNELGGELEGLAGALVAGGGIGGVLYQALDTSSLNTKIDISLEVPESSKKAVKDAVKEVEAYGVDAEAALEGVRRQWTLNKDATDETNQAIIKGAATIASSYSGIDFTELIQETNEISRELNISNQEALGLTNALLKMGFPPEQLDIITEYGAQLQRAGYSGAEIQALFAAGVETGTWNIDVLLDGLKEGRILLSEFGAGVDETTAELLKGTGISAKQLQEWGKAVAAGGEAGSKAMVDVAKAVESIKDETDRNLVGVKLFGTLYEENGSHITQTLINAKDATVDLKANQDLLNQSTEKLNADPAVQLQQALSNLKNALEPLLLVIAGFVSSVAEWASKNPELTATLTAIASAIGIIIGVCIALAPIFATLSGAMVTFGVSLSGILIPVGLVVAGIAALIAIGVLLWKNWDIITTKAKELWGKVQETWRNFKSGTQSAFENIKTSASSKIEEMKNAVSNKLSALRDKISGILTSAKNVTSNILENIKNTGREKFESLRTAVQEKITATKAKIEEIWGKVKKFLAGINLTSIGKDIIQGLIDGIAAKAGSLMNKARDIANNIKKTIKGALDIHSPSRVMRDEVGKWIPEGVAAGIEGNMSSIGRAVDKMAEATIPTLPSINASSGGQIQSGDSFTFDGMFSGAQFIIREEADIEKLAEKLYQKQRRAARSMGVVRK